MRECCRGTCPPGPRVIALDVDPQTSLTYWAKMGKSEEILRGIVQTADAEDHTAFSQVVNEARREADYVFIDTPPGLGLPSITAALLSDSILLPCIPTAPDVMSLKGSIETMRAAKREMFVVPWMQEMRHRITEQMLQMIELLGLPSAPGASRRAAYAQSAFFGQIVTEYAPKSPAADEVMCLTDWLIAERN